MDAPLASLLVADFTQNVAGPYCTQILADMGAQVVKVERPGRGDDSRAWAPPYWGQESAAFMSVNRNKRSLAVDMKAPEGREILERLVARGDVLVQSLRAGVIEELGLGWDRTRRLNPRLVYCSVTAFGADGPYRDRPGYDPLMQAYGGLMSITGHPGAPPARVPVSLVDMGTGMWAATAVLAALRERDRTGRGVHVTTALFDTALAWTAFQMTNYLASGEIPEPQGSGTPARVKNRSALFETLASVTRTLSSPDLLARLQTVGVPSAPILTLDHVAAEPQTEASGLLIRAKHPRVPEYRAVGLPIKWDGERPGLSRVPPLLGELTAEVLAVLGYDDATIEELAARHVIQL